MARTALNLDEFMYPRIVVHHRHDIDIQELELTRRSFFNTAASGVGGLRWPAFSSRTDSSPPRPRQTRSLPRALISLASQELHFLLYGGRAIQIDLFDPKPKLNELHGQVLPESMTKNSAVRVHQQELQALGIEAGPTEARSVWNG